MMLNMNVEVLMMLLAGVQSTASTLSWLVYALCKHPEVQTEAQHQVIHHTKNRQSGFLISPSTCRFAMLGMRSWIADACLLTIRTSSSIT